MHHSQSYSGMAVRTIAGHRPTSGAGTPDDETKTGRASVPAPNSPHRPLPQAHSHTPPTPRFRPWCLPFIVRDWSGSAAGEHPTELMSNMEPWRHFAAGKAAQTQQMITQLRLQVGDCKVDHAQSNRHHSMPGYFRCRGRCH